MSKIPQKNLMERLKTSEEAIKKQKEEIFRLKSIIDELPGDIYWKDKDGVYLGVNRTSVESLRKMGFAQCVTHIVGRTDYDIFNQQTADIFRNNDLDVMKTGGEVVLEETATLPSGEKKAQLSTKKPLFDINGKIIGTMGNTVDITYLKKVEMDLRVAKEKAEESNRVKMEFISNMEHDLRTPFTGAFGIATYLFENETNEEKKTLLKCILQSIKELLDFCNTIFDFSHIETTSRPVLAKKFNIREVVESTFSIELPAAQFKKLQFTYHIDDNLPDIFIGDGYRLHRVLLNLVSNAIKFTDQGSVKIFLKCAKIEAKRIIVKLIVQDSGIGIPKEKQDMIYEAFTKVTPSNLGKYAGLGLGMRIVKKFVEEMDGEIELVSEVGKGTTFTCIMPFKLPLLRDSR